MTVLGLSVGVLAQTNGNAGVAAKGQDNAFFAGPGTHGATLNGQPLLPGTVILQGETVQTGPNGVVVMAPTHGAGGVLELSDNGTATVQTGAVQASVGTDQLEIQQGNAVVTGNVSVITPQGQTFRPVTKTTSYVVNVDSKQSTMGVLTGSVNTFSPRSATATNAPPPPPAVVNAGNAVQISTNTITGQVQLNNVRLDQVVQPSAQAAVPQTPTASQSQ